MLTTILVFASSLIRMLTCLNQHRAAMADLLKPPAFMDCRNLDPEYTSPDWCEHKFEFYLHPFLLAQLELIKVYDVLSSLFKYDTTEALIAQ